MISFPMLLRLSLSAIVNPREAATHVLSLGVPRAALWPLYFLVVVGSVLLTALAELIDPMTNEAGTLSIPPFLFAFSLGALLAVYVYGLYLGGRKLGGQGSFEETLLIIVFLQLILIAVQVVELVLLILAPPLASLLVFAAAFYGIWLSMNFVDVLHGFGSLMKAFLLIIGVSLAIAVLFVLLLSVTGLGGYGAA